MEEILHQRWAVYPFKNTAFLYIPGIGVIAGFLPSTVPSSYIRFRLLWVGEMFDQNLRQIQALK